MRQAFKERVFELAKYNELSKKPVYEAEADVRALWDEIDLLKAKR